jgi:hypothetical protein
MYYFNPMKMIVYIYEGYTPFSYHFINLTYYLQMDLQTIL